MSLNHPRDVRFQCLKCAVCCGDTGTKVRHILMLESETMRVADATSKPIEEFAVKIENHSPYVYEMRKTAEEGRCFFLEDRHCAIYPLRPLVCRFYPFELREAGNGKHAFLFTKECPGIGRGKKLTGTYFKDLFRQLTLLVNTSHGGPEDR